MSSHEPLDPSRYRTVLGHLPTGVTVVTAPGPVGMACNSFTSVSLDPPLVSFCAGNASETWPGIREAHRFAVNVLSEAQHELGHRFAAKGINRFEGVPWHPSSGGSPLLDEALAWLDCRIEAEHAAGDHTIVIGRVLELDVAGAGSPLVFFRGDFGALARA